jgi:Phage portal protein, SPP1 Gp6-like.
LNARVANDYFNGINRTIEQFQKFIYDTYGTKVPDIWSPNHKIACHDYRYLIIQKSLYLLGNGVSFGDPETKAALGKTFDQRAVDMLIEALNGAVSFSFVNIDHIEVFSIREFAPLYDEETGALRAGVRWWQLEDGKPLRATLFEMDGYTEFIRPKNAEMTILAEKRPYKVKVAFPMRQARPFSTARTTRRSRLCLYTTTENVRR